jgi:RNA polymerase sigma-70 factor, ECF subfamily
MEDQIFELIYEQTSRPLWAYVARISGDRSAADDILQETYLRFLNSPPRNIDVQESKPYLYRIATNLVYDRFRKLKRRGETEIADEAVEAESSIGADMEMMQVFYRLKEQERMLLWLAYVEGYEHKQIANILKVNPLSVKVLLFRARRRLATLLGV